MSAIADMSAFAEPGKEPGTHHLYLLVDGMRCASCAWNIENTLNAEPNTHARMNFSTRRLSLDWQGDAARANALVAKASGLGFRFTPFDASQLNRQDEDEARFLMRCLAVAGFASGNIMIFSLALWFSNGADMGIGTRTFMHWVTGLIAMPAIIYSGRPFFRSAWSSLRHGRTNMDVPISLAVILAAAMSVLETIRHGEYVYFDASVMLLFFLLIGRYLDRKARGRAREAAQDLLSMLQGSATIRDGDTTRAIPIRDLKPDMRLLVAAGERIAADGVVASGTTDIDTSLITGETVPRKAEPGQKLFAGMTNMSAPIEMIISAAGESSLLADIVRMMENAEQGHARYVRLADKVASLYTPIVHLLAFGTFAGWLLAGMDWQPALMIATTVLIITCPCALGLAVPAVQVLASGRLFKGGMLLKSGDALERLANIDSVVFDKTGTLTLGKPQLVNASSLPSAAFQLAASMAASSRHPLSRAVTNAYHGALLPLTVKEEPGNGLIARHQEKTIRLGRRDWCGDHKAPGDSVLELWLAEEGADPIRFEFSDVLRDDAAAVISQLQRQGLEVLLLSGDREPVVKAMAHTLGITEWQSAMTPSEKHDRIHALKLQGKHTLMVGDGLNDAPALAAAHVSISPSTAMDITQNAADIVFQGEHLSPVLEALFVARQSSRLVKQNFLLSFVYNVLAVPLAVLGHVTPLIASVAMSSSSLLVVANALRLNYMKRET